MPDTFREAERRRQEAVVWVVDDNSAVASSLVLLLDAAEGIKALARLNAQEVLADLANGIAPAAMVLDLGMPHNGNALLKALVARPDLAFPVVVQTGYDDPLPPEVARRVTKVVRKPGDPLEMVELIRRAVGGGAT